MFGRIATGKRRFTLGGVQMQWRLQRKRDVQGLRFGDDNTVQIGRGIRAVELHLIEDAAGLHFDADHWAAVDSRNYVYTPAGVQPPRDDGSNATPGGLTADKRKRYTYRADEKANR